MMGYEGEDIFKVRGAIVIFVISIIIINKRKKAEGG